jgi:two-component system cell cycle sensor histidine kinase/response regulator CckA
MLRPSLLIVDDEGSIRLFADRALTAVGYAPHTAASGPEALRLIETHGRPFDVFVIDVTMPLMLGTRHRPRAADSPHDSNAKILYLTGFADRLFAEKLRL